MIAFGSCWYWTRTVSPWGPHATRVAESGNVRAQETGIREAQALALLWRLSTRDKIAADARYFDGLKLIERASTDERHFV